MSVENDLDSLVAPFRQKAYRLVEAIESNGLPFRVFEARRPFLRSHQLFLQGRQLHADGSITVTDPKKIVTKARAGESPHNWGMAIDCILVIDHEFWVEEGEVHAPTGPWDTGYDGNRLNRPHVKLAWEKYVRLIKAEGLVAGAEFRSFPDLPHCEMPSWKTYRPATWKEVVSRSLSSGLPDPARS